MSVQGEAKPQILRDLLASQDTLATVIVAILVRTYGAEVYEWEPETVWIQVQEDFGVEMPEICHMRAVSLLAAIHSGEFYRDPAVFSATCEILSGTPSELDELSPDLLPAEIAWGVMEVRLNDDDRPVFSYDVARLAGLSLEEDGFSAPPRQVPWAIVEPPPEFDPAHDEAGWHSAVIDEYMAGQAQTLFAQISQLPWASEVDMESLSGLIAGEAGVVPSVADFSPIPDRSGA